MDEGRRRQAYVERFWQERAQRGLSEGAARFHSDHTPFDLELISRHCRDGMRVLDLGAGTCDVSSALIDRFHVDALAVDRHAEFLAQARPSPQLRTEAADLRTYRADGRYDLVLLLGVITHLLAPDDRRELYQRIAGWMAPGASLLVKAQFGVAGPITVDKFSAEVGTRYVAHYPGIEDEVRLLEETYRVTRHDPYPPALHRFADTHFYFLACAKR